MSHISDSLFELSKVKDPLNNDKFVSQEVHTVNFESTGELGPEVRTYFQSRFRFLKASYDFAKQLKVEQNIDFEDNATIQGKMIDYLIEKPVADMVKGAEFGVISTKVVESLKSINKNEYLKKLKEGIIKSLFDEANPEISALLTPKPKQTKEENSANKKIYNDELKKYRVGVDDLLKLNGKVLLKLFRYDVLNQVKIWKVLTDKLRQQETLNNFAGFERTDIATLCDSFIYECETIFNNTVDDTQKFLKQGGFKNPNDVVEGFVNRFFFQFDDQVRKIEDEYLNDLNEKINRFVQHIGHELEDRVIGDVDDDERQAVTTELKKLSWNLTKLDFEDENTPEHFVLLLDLALNKDWEEIKSKGPKKNYEDKVTGKGWFFYDNLFLRRPKSAPSYPSIKDKIIEWDKDKRTSVLLEEKRSNFDSVKFMDFWLARCKRIIENSEVYKVYKHSVLFSSNEDREEKNDPSEFVWIDWLNRIVNNLDLENFSLNRDKLHFKSRFFDKNSRYVDSIVFVHDKTLVSETVKYRENNRLSRLSFARELKNHETRTHVEYLTWWIVNEFKQLSMRHVELGLIRKYYSSDIDQSWMRKWLDLLQSNNAKIRKEKFAVRTENRLNKIVEFADVQWDVESFVTKLETELHKLENHLLLNNSHEEFRIFDNVSFKRYQNISQMIFESIYRDAKKIRLGKAELAKLSVKKEVVLPIKIDRMTFNKPNGKSSLAFEVEVKDLLVTKFQIIPKSSNIIIYPVNLGVLNGENIKLVETLNEAQKWLKTGKYARLFIGFLNGSNDNKADKKFIEAKDKNDLTQIVKDKDGNDRVKGYQIFTNWKLIDALSKVEYKDEFRADGESAGMTNPAGYPKLYYFLIPKVCNNLIIPVETNIYYLIKYTPYHHLNEYFALEKEVYELSDQGANYENEQAKNKIKEILKLRAKLRYYYRLSSLELDLIQEYKLNTIEKKIDKIITAKAHMQFGNPVGYVADTKDSTKSLFNFDIDGVKKKFKTILSIDLGEKHIACMTLSEVDWDTLSLKKENRVQSFLPLGEKPKSDGVESDFHKIFNRTAHIISPELDTTFRNFKGIIYRYEKEQKQYGVVRKKLAKSKNDFTDQIIEKISTQIVKLAVTHESFVVFENLPKNGFGSDKYQLSLYTEVYRHTVKKLQKVGMVTLFDYMKFEPSDFRSGIAFVVASMTSKTCSVCGYVPKYIKSDSQIDGVVINDKWGSDGLIEFSFQDKTILKIKDTHGDVEVFDIQNKPVQDRDYFYKDKTSFKQENVFVRLKRNLFTEVKLERKLKINSDTFSFILKQLLNPRLKQDTYDCLCCNNKGGNADYQASLNIGKKFLRKMEEANNKNLSLYPKKTTQALNLS